MANDLTLTSPVWDTTTQKFGTGALAGGYGMTPTGFLTTYGVLPLTLEGWTKGSVQPTSIQVFLGQNYFGYLGTDASGNLTAQYLNASLAYVNLTTTINIFDGAWHHLALVFQSTGSILYLDGVAVASSTQAAIFSNIHQTDPFGINNHGGLPNYQWPGEADEIAIWSTARYTANFTPPTAAYAGTESGLVALWHLDSNGTDSKTTTAATAYTLTGPSTGTPGTASSAFTVAANGSLAASVTVTPSDGAAGGTFTPASVTLAAGSSPSATFTYTAASAGSFTISTTNTGGLTNPGSVTYTASTTSVSIAPNNTSILYSPYNWNVGANAAISINGGGDFRVAFSGASCTLNFDVSQMITSPSEIYWRVDHYGPRTLAQVASTIVVSIPTDTASWTEHLLEVWIKGTSEFQAPSGMTGQRWNPISSPNTAVKFTGLTLASGASVFAPIAAPLNILALGDSITEGYRTVNSSASADVDWSDSTLGWAFMLGELLGAEIGIVGFGGQGWNVGGVGSVPSFPNTYGYLYSGQARAFTPAPNLIVINMGQNDGTNNTVANVTAVLNGLLAACPTTPIAVLEPFSGNQAANLQSGIAACNAPSRVHYVGTAGWFDATLSTDGLHPLGIANRRTLGPNVAAALQPLLSGSGTPTYGPWFRNRFGFLRED